ncbi:hypothetical protein GCM10007962_22060 [Yeosuana aromativorans]|uniref:Uncharacterized protein n=1 Tax=Yeosuana aromativorans TaxID=288019 RepID=A0A8J3BL85_9FLAO|nr:hypothetical protein [Yeosuana aromativorans]GGK27418.1 hypothetical protein GCM10007962_22060 [Yeosuana aromativorans]
MRSLLFFITVLAISSSIAQNYDYGANIPLEDYNFVLGTNSFPTKYQFSNDSKLIEQARQTRALGSNIFKTSITERSLKDYGFKADDANNIMDVIDLIPDYDKVFEMDFKYYFFWLHTATGIKWRKGISKNQEKRLYNEMFNFASYLLKKYDNTGKTFLIGNWEGDWLLHTNKDRNMTPSKEAVENMTKWFQIRQRAIADAKDKSNSKNVYVYYYIEVNLAAKGMEGETCITKDILPNVDVDLVSYSSYESSKKKDYQANKESLTTVLNYIEGQLKPKEGLPFKRRVFIGEYGGQAFDDKPETYLRQFDNAKDIMQISLEEDLPFALYWQMYNNEYTKDGKSKNMSLINEKGEKRPLYYLHQNYYKQVNEYLKKYKLQHEVYPSHEDFKIQALKVLEDVYNEIRLQVLTSLNLKK